MPQTKARLAFRLPYRLTIGITAVIGAFLLTATLLGGMVTAAEEHPHDHTTGTPTMVNTADDTTAAANSATAIYLLEANLSPASEVPAVDSVAGGRAVLALMTDTLSYRVFVADIDNVTAAHIHEGAPGANGPVIVPLFGGSGVFDPANPISGTLTLTPTQVMKLLAGDYYINVHTSDFPGGEVRGQVRTYTPPAKHNALLLGRNEVPAVTTSAKGVARFTIVNTDTLQYQIAVSNIVSITAAHIHFGPIGKNGGVVHGLYSGSGAFDPANPLSGTLTLTNKNLVDLLTGYYYVNIHTSANPSGEIRGQIGGTRLFQANLSGAAEVPPRIGNASGRAVLALSADATKLTYRVMVNDIISITAAHIHRAPAGANGGVIFNLVGSGGFSTQQPVSGTLDLSTAQVMDLISDNYYVNVHTTSAPAGAIRGQVLPYQPTAHMMAPLTGASEVPAVNTNAVGVARFILNSPLDTLHYSAWVTDIISVTAAHIHVAPAGKNGPVVFPLSGGSTPFDPLRPIGGGVALNAQNWVDLLTGYYYVNVHTTANPSGAIRGQIGGARLFQADLMGSNEVPEVTTAATGRGVLALNANATAVSYRVMVKDIDKITMAHIHQGPAGVNGPVVAPIFLGGLFDPANPVSGTVPVNTLLVLNMLSGDYYVNVHTIDFPAGEIRGQIEAYVPEAKWVATLNGAQEVPPVTTTAAGQAYFALNGELNLLHYSVSVTNIVTITAAHIHLAPAGKNGPVVFGLHSQSQGRFDATNPLGGCLALTGKDLVDLVTGYHYVNVHTTTNAGGEIRGQLQSVKSSFMPLAAKPQ
jgi:hypothetical protein